MKDMKKSKITCGEPHTFADAVLFPSDGVASGSVVPTIDTARSLASRKNLSRRRTLNFSNTP
jgi:hypothetical protein